MTDGLQGLSDRDILIQVWTRQQDMGERLDAFCAKLDSIVGKVDSHERAISRIHGIGGVLAFIYSGALAALGIFARGR